jgi:signal transduction histidine kinase
VLSTLSLATAAVFAIRFRQDRHLRHLWCAYGFALVALSSLSLAVARALPTSMGIALDIAFTARVVGVAVVAAAAFESRRGRTGAGSLAVGLLLPVVITIAGALLVSADIAVVAARTETPVLVLDHSAIPWDLLVAQLLAFIVMAAGVRAWSRIGRTDGDDLARWLGGGLVLLLMARGYLLVYPGASTGWFHVADLCRAVGHATIFVAVARSAIAGWRGMVVEAGLQERRRMAGDLHDGLAQELALLTSQSRWLARRSAGSDDELQFVATIAQRALDESRRAIFALRHGPDAERVVDLPALSLRDPSNGQESPGPASEDNPMAASG